ncbi:MAG: hypothetical protein WCA32_07030 [Chromatiaceae bacterium]
MQAELVELIWLEKNALLSVASVAMPHGKQWRFADVRVRGGKPLFAKALAA